MQNILRIYDILYHVEPQEVVNALDAMKDEEVADILDIYASQWTLIGNNEKLDLVNKALNEGKILPEDLLGLPKEMDFPAWKYDAKNYDIQEGRGKWYSEKDIAEWISDETGYGIDGFSMKSMMEKEAIYDRISDIKNQIPVKTWELLNELLMLRNVIDVADEFACYEKEDQEMEF